MKAAVVTQSEGSEIGNSSSVVPDLCHFSNNVPKHIAELGLSRAMAVSSVQN